MIKTKDIAKDIGYLENCLMKVSTELEKLKKKVPEGARLRAVRHRNGYQYFIKIKEYGKNGKYIKKNERKKAEILAQIEYDEKLIVVLKNMLVDLNKWQELCIDNPFAIAENQMIDAKKELIYSHYTSDENYVIRWKNQEYEGLGFREGFPEYYTRRGLRVRSKSEVIIADILDELFIPFLYEKPLQLQTGMVHPDFTLLNIKDRSEVYWEHFGMMDDIEYRNNALLKIRKYEESGFYQHDSVIWTFETGSYPLNTKELRKMIKNLKEKLGY